MSKISISGPCRFVVSLARVKAFQASERRLSAGTSFLLVICYKSLRSIKDEEIFLMKESGFFERLNLLPQGCLAFVYLRCWGSSINNGTPADYVTKACC